MSHRASDPQNLLLAQTLDCLPDPAWVKDVSGRWTLVNAAAASILGLPSRQLIGLRDRDVLSADVASAIELEDTRILVGGETIRVEETLFNAAAGELRLFSSVKAPLRNKAGEIVGLIGTARDVTDERRQEVAIADERERVRLATQAADIGIWDLDTLTEELRWDDRCKALFGLPADAVVSYEKDFVAALHPDDRERVLALVQTALDPAGPGEFATEYRVRGVQAGVERWLSAHGHAYFQDGQAVRFLGTVMDVTERKRTEEALAEALQQREALLYEVNHRVKNSLQMIIALLTLQERRSENEETRRSLADVRTRIGVVGSIHQSLYTTAAHREVEICGFLDRLARSTVQSIASAAHIQLVVDARCEANIDIQRAVPIALIVSELLTNALKYAFSEQRPGVLRVEVDQRDNKLVIVVEDDGVGLGSKFDLASPNGVGTQVIAVLAKQLHAKVDVSNREPGVRFTIAVPGSST